EGYLVLPLQKDLLVEVGSLIGEGFGSGCRSDDRTTINLVCIYVLAIYFAANPLHLL
ncbi:unnamed protein product, partial [Musa textilis]